MFNVKFQIVICYFISLQAAANSMFDVESQWMYLVTDSSSSNMDMSPFFRMTKDGYNVGFVYNASNPGPCDTGIMCVSAELVTMLGRGMEKTLVKELQTFDEVGTSPASLGPLKNYHIILQMKTRI